MDRCSSAFIAPTIGVGAAPPPGATRSTRSNFPVGGAGTWTRGVAAGAPQAIAVTTIMDNKPHEPRDLIRRTPIANVLQKHVRRRAEGSPVSTNKTNEKE